MVSVLFHFQHRNTEANWKQDKYPLNEEIDYEDYHDGKHGNTEADWKQEKYPLNEVIDYDDYHGGHHGSSNGWNDYSSLPHLKGRRAAYLILPGGFNRHKSDGLDENGFPLGILCNNQIKYFVSYQRRLSPILSILLN